MFEHPAIPPCPPARSVHKINESLPERTAKSFCSRVCSMYCKILSKFPLLSFTPIILSIVLNLPTVAGAMALPVRAGILYRTIGISTFSATVLKWVYNSSCDAAANEGVMIESTSTPTSFAFCDKRIVSFVPTSPVEA